MTRIRNRSSRVCLRILEIVANLVTQQVVIEKVSKIKKLGRNIRPPKSNVGFAEVDYLK